MKYLIIASLMFVGCGSAEDLYNAAHSAPVEAMELSHDVIYGTDEEPTEVATPTPDCDPTLLVCE